jgi:hypothetical protein
VKPRKPLARRQGFKARPKPLKRTPIKRAKLNPISDKKRAENKAAKGMFDEFNETHTSCAICWWFPGTGRAGRYGRHLHRHHLSKGSSRKHDRRLIVMCCDRCHRHLHDGGELDAHGNRLPPLVDGHMMQAKWESDREHYSEAAVCEAYGWANLPDKWERRPIPAAFERERTINTLGR